VRYTGCAGPRAAVRPHHIAHRAKLVEVARTATPMIAHNRPMTGRPRRSVCAADDRSGCDTSGQSLVEILVRAAEPLPGAMLLLHSDARKSSQEAALTLGRGDERERRHPLVRRHPGLVAPCLPLRAWHQLLRVAARQVIVGTSSVQVRPVPAPKSMAGQAAWSSRVVWEVVWRDGVAYDRVAG
jgi:hypothetical protein